MSFDNKSRKYLEMSEGSLKLNVDKYFLAGSRVSEAAEYSLLNGGKRVRGTLVLAVCDMLGGNIDAALDYAAAIEMIHASSLIHDDLPCMDNDDMRRGKPSCHVAYGEDTALLAGDMLLIAAFEVISASGNEAKQVLAACRELAKASGGRGMIYGQELDLESEGKLIGIKTLETIHKYKTGALISAAINLGAIAAGFDAGAVPGLDVFGSNIGLVFQIVDDILDVTSTEIELGKPIGSDSKQGKTTYISYYGIEKSKKLAFDLTDEAIASIQAVYGDNSAYLCEFAKSLANRIY